MKCDVKVSIITTCLNSADTIRQTIESVLNQTYPNIEYIIVDGCSKDGTLSIIQEYIPLFNGRLRFVSEKDKGIYYAMNKGIKMSHGMLIGIINSDDFYEPTTVEKVVSHYLYNENQVIYGYIRILKNNRTKYVYTISHKSYRQKDMIPHPTCFVSRNVYRKYGLFDTRFKLASDYDLMMRLYGEDVKFTQVQAILANFRLGGASTNKRVYLETEMIHLKYHCISIREYIEFLVEYVFCM
jgi:glycosyltransferase involved in cell wall biosynthesis